MKNMPRRIIWFLGLVSIAVVLWLVIGEALPILFYPNLPYFNFFKFSFWVLALGCVLSIYRVCKGPTASDRIVAVDILGILIIGFCACLSIPTGRTWYLNVSIAWVVQSFVSTLALAKYLENKDFDE